MSHNDSAPSHPATALRTLINGGRGFDLALARQLAQKLSSRITDPRVSAKLNKELSDQIERLAEAIRNQVDDASERELRQQAHTTLARMIEACRR